MEKRNETISLRNILHKLEEKIALDSSNAELQNEIIDKKANLEIAALYQAKGPQVRARTKWIEEGEKNTKFFLNLEKNNRKRNTMLKLIDDDGTIYTEQFEVLNQQCKFYKKLVR